MWKFVIKISSIHETNFENGNWNQQVFVYYEIAVLLIFTINSVTLNSWLHRAMIFRVTICELLLNTFGCSQQWRIRDFPTRGGVGWATIPKVEVPQLQENENNWTEGHAFLTPPFYGSANRQQQWSLKQKLHRNDHPLICFNHLPVQHKYWRFFKTTNVSCFALKSEKVK